MPDAHCVSCTRRIICWEAIRSGVLDTDELLTVGADVLPEFCQKPAAECREPIPQIELPEGVTNEPRVCPEVIEQVSHVPVTTFETGRFTVAGTTRGSRPLSQA